MGVAAEDSLEAGALTTQSIRASVIIADLGLRVLHVEGPAFDRHGHRIEDWPGRSLNEVLPAGLMAELEPRCRAALAGDAQSFYGRSHDGSRAYWAQITPVRGGDGAVTSVVAVMQDVTDRPGTIDDLTRSGARLDESERMVSVGSWELVLETDVMTYSQGFARLLGLAPGERLDLAGFVGMVHPEDRQILVAAHAECLKTGSAQCDFRLVTRDGTVRTLQGRGETVAADPHGREYLCGAILDVTEQRAAEVERLEAVSMFRQGFDAAQIGMVFTDADTGWCIRVNDALCALLNRPREQPIGASLDAVIHPDDRPGVHEARHAITDCSGLIVEQHELRYLRPDGTVRWAALNAAPVFSATGTLQAVFSQVIDITERKEREAEFENDVDDALWLERIRDAIDDDRLVLYSQPIVDLLTGETVQHELLIRSRGRDGSIIAPGEFLPIAERYGLISEIDRWVIRQAVNRAAGGEATEFNLSAASIGDPTVLRELASAIQETGADPSLLVVEVTETAMINQFDAGRRFAEQVTALGCRLALDDFGTGFASLSYLKQIPAQLLKIDIEFVRDLTRSETDERLVRGIIGIAREFDQTTVADGIEDQATLVRLRELGVHLGQGYVFGRPQPLAGEDLSAAVEADSCAPGSDPVGLVRAAFDAFASRDVDTLIGLCRPDIVLRPHTTTEHSGHHDPYRGHAGLRAYVDDIPATWRVLTPTTFRRSNQAVFVFGHADAETDADPGKRTQAMDVLWVWRLRGDLIASVEVFRTLRRDPARGSDRACLSAALVARPPQTRKPHQATLARRDDAGPEQGGRPTPPSLAGTTDRLSRAYASSLRVGDPHTAAVVIDDALAGGLSSVEIHSRVIAPAMWRIGELWERGRLTVAEEHLATAVSHHVLTRLYPGLLNQSKRRGDTVVVAAVHGEHHVLGLRMAADVLEGAGFDVRFLGADLPWSSLLAWVSEHRPAAVALGVTMPLGAAALGRQLQALHDYDPEIHLIVGGQGVPRALRQGAGVFYAADTERLAEYLNRAVKDRPRGELPRGIAGGGVRFGSFLGAETGMTDGLEARMAQTTAAAADAARAQARRAFVLEQIAFRDPLTDLWSRRAFDDRYQDLTAGEITRAPTVLMIDVDRFKSVNDAFGHDAGDHALIEIAACITRSIRPKDFAARSGGDEFAVLLPDTSAEVAAQIGERIRSAVTSKLTDPPMTVSIGASVPDHVDRRRATLDVDRALHEAKQHGRNQIVFA